MPRRVISVLGGASPRPGSPAYQEAYKLGELLARSGHAVATGGYSGTMEAVSRGAAEAGGHVIGVTLILWGEPNRWVAEEIRCQTMLERLSHLVGDCDGAVALRGGIGTLSEVALMWSLLQVAEVKPKPLVLLGRRWEVLLTSYYGQGEYIKAADMQLWRCVEIPEEALDALHDGLEMTQHNTSPSA
jgi:uncharacterized protein (TIGR00725 family)